MLTKPLWQELKHLHPSVHVHIISQLLERHPNLHADTSWDVLAKQLFMNHDYARYRESPSILTLVLFGGNRKPPPASINHLWLTIVLSQLQMETTGLNVCEAKIC